MYKMLLLFDVTVISRPLSETIIISHFADFGDTYSLFIISVYHIVVISGNYVLTKNITQIEAICVSSV